MDKSIAIKAFLGVFLPFIFLVVSCKKKEVKEEEKTEDPNPVACYTAANKFLTVSEVINFSNCSQNYDRVEWNFGDSESSTISEPSHKWGQAGFYDVVLKAFKANIASTTSKKIVVGKTCSLDFKADFSDWTGNSKYFSISCYVTLHKSSDLFSPYYMIHSVSRSVPSPSYAAASSAPISETSTFRIKILVTGVYKNSNVNITERVDSVITDDIDIFTGPKTPKGTSDLTLSKVSYTIGAVTFN